MARPLRTLCVGALSTLAVTLAPAAGAEIYKCVDGGRTAYQSWPCAAGAVETKLAPSAATRPEAPPPARADAPATARMRGPWRHTTLTLGMSDDEVLNMPEWGRPNRVTRIRRPHEWREEWVYGQGAGAERRLVFANARLVDVVVDTPAERLAALPQPAY